VGIRRSASDVFDYCTDMAREPEWNPRTRSVEKLTEGPVGLGTRYRAEWMQGDPMVVEYVRFDRPSAWAGVGRSHRLTTKSEGRVSPTEDGVRLLIRMELLPRGLFMFLLPLIGPLMRRRETRNLAAIKAALEA
jgi:Polyketide cyclase / dehydrase and lipid transport